MSSPRKNHRNAKKLPNTSKIESFRVLSLTVGVRNKVQEGARYKVQEGVLYKIQSPFFRQIFPEGALYKVQW